MSKWLKNKEKIFSQFKEQKKLENEQQAGPRRLDIVWKTPERGTQEKPKNYLIRFLPDQNDNFYKTMHYHMFKSNKGKWTFALCPKTYDFEAYCPICSATMKLYQGSKEDKQSAYNYKRKTKYCGNIYVVKDPRDADAESENDKNSGKVKIFEFPGKVEQNIKNEMVDEEFGAGMSLFDPGDDGVDFLLKVGATKPTAGGQVFHDYSQSKVTNKPYALGSDVEIMKIMGSTHNIDEYLETMTRSQDELIRIVKDEYLWDLISSDFPSEKVEKRKMSSSADMDEIPTGDEPEKEESKEESKEEEVSDDDLLKELEGLG